MGGGGKRDQGSKRKRREGDEKSDEFVLFFLRSSTFLRRKIIGCMSHMCNGRDGGMGGWGDTDRLPFSLVSSPP